MMRLPDIGVPVLAVLGTEPDPMGWGTPAGRRALAPAARRPARDARRRRPLRPHRAAPRRSPTSCWSTWRDAPCCLRHNKVRARPARAAGRRGSPAAPPPRPGRAHPGGGAGAPRRLAGPGVGPRPLRPRRLRRGRRRRATSARRSWATSTSPSPTSAPVTIYGRGLGAYVGLLAAGGRAEQVRGAILADGPGLAGGGPSPGVARRSPPRWAPPPPGGTPDPWALYELTRDVRPPDYAATFARQATTRSRPRHGHRRGRRQPPAVARGRGRRARRRRVHPRPRRSPLFALPACSRTLRPRPRARPRSGPGRRGRRGPRRGSRPS